MNWTTINKIYRVLLLSVLCLVANMVSAQNEGFKPVTNTAEVEQTLIQASAKMKSLSSDFVQQKKLEYLETTIESNGKFWFKDGTKLRWEYTSPFEYIIVANNGKFMIKDEEKTSVYDTKSNKAFEELNQILISTVNGTLIRSGKFKVNIKENASAYLVELEPENEQMKLVLKNIHLYFSKTDYTVYKVKMIESAQDYTIITFSNKKINSQIPESIFNL